MGKDVVVQQIEKTILSNETVRGSLNMVSINTKYPEKCLQLLDLVNCDTKLRDLFYFGEEGVNFEYTADGKVMKSFKIKSISYADRWKLMIAIAPCNIVPILYKTNSGIIPKISLGNLRVCSLECKWLIGNLPMNPIFAESSKDIHAD